MQSWWRRHVLEAAQVAWVAAGRVIDEHPKVAIGAATIGQLGLQRLAFDHHHNLVRLE